jgi:hypothetical protein
VATRHPTRSPRQLTVRWSHLRRAAFRKRTGSRSPNLAAAIILPAIFSRTASRWPVARSSLQAASKASLIATSASGPNAPGSMNERHSMAAPFPFSGGSATGLSATGARQVVADDVNTVRPPISVSGLPGEMMPLSGKQFALVWAGRPAPEPAPAATAGPGRMLLG